MELSFECFTGALESDNLNVRDEETLIELVRTYIDVREKSKPQKVKKAKDLVKKELWGLLNSDEKKSRKDAFKAEKEALKDAKAKALEKDAEVYWKKSPVERI